MVMPEQNILSFDAALKELDTISKESFNIDVWIPSQKKYFKIKELTAKQQKLIIESILDTTNKTTFSKTFFEIVKENWLDEYSDLENLTIIDKVSIAFYIRKELSNTLNVDFNDDMSLIKSVDLLPIIDSLKEYAHPEDKTFKYEKNSIVVEVEFSIPLFKNEWGFDLYILNSTNYKDKVENVKDILSTTFISELAKYIKEIKIDGKLFNYNNLDISQKVEVVGKLPASLVQNIFEEIFKIKTNLEKIYTITYENLSKKIEVDGLLFLVN
jgi:hypothetical protein